MENTNAIATINLELKIDDLLLLSGLVQEREFFLSLQGDQISEFDLQQMLELQRLGDDFDAKLAEKGIRF